MKGSESSEQRVARHEKELQEYLRQFIFTAANGTSIEDCTHFLGAKRYIIPSAEFQRFYSLKIFKDVRDNFAPFVNFNERNGPKEPFRRYVIDIDEQVTDKEIEGYVEYVQDILSIPYKRRPDLHMAVLRNIVSQKAHIHFLNIVCVDKKVYGKISKLLLEKFPNSGIDMKAGLNLFMVYGSGKCYPNSGNKPRNVPYTYRWSAILTRDKEWHYEDDKTGPRIEEQPELPIAAILSLRRPVTKSDIIIADWTQQKRLEHKAESDSAAKRKGTEEDDEETPPPLPLHSSAKRAKVNNNTENVEMANMKREKAKVGLTPNHKRFSQLIVNSWAQYSIQYNDWFRVLCAIINTIDPFDPNYARSLAHSFSQNCQEKYDFHICEQKINKILLDAETSTSKCYFRHIIPLTPEEHKLTEQVMFTANATWGRETWIEAFAKHFFRDYNIIVVPSPVAPKAKMLLCYVAEKGVYRLFEEDEIMEEYARNVRKRIMSFFDKLLSRFFNNFQQFAIIMEQKKAFEESRTSRRCNIPQEFYQCLLTSSKHVTKEEFERRRFYMVFRNKTLNLDTGEMEEHSPNHYCMAYNDNTIDIQNKDILGNIAKFQRILHQICPDEETLENFYIWCQSCLPGGNFWRSILIMRGEKRNGKSLIQKIFERAFNSHYLITTLPADQIQDDPKALNTNYENCLGEERIILIHEVTFMCTPKAQAIIKAMTGGDKLKYRLPYGRGSSEHEIFGQLWITTNAKPAEMGLGPHMSALNDRIHVFPMPSLFLKPEEYERRKGEPNVHLADPTLSLPSTLSKFGEALINILVYRYRKQNKRREPGGVQRFFQTEPLDSPQMVSAKCQILQACDPLFQYCTDHLSYARDEFVTAYEMYNQFRTNLPTTLVRFWTFSFFVAHLQNIINDGWLGPQMRKHFKVVQTKNVKKMRFENCRIGQIIMLEESSDEES